MLILIAVFTQIIALTLAATVPLRFATPIAAFGMRMLTVIMSVGVMPLWFPTLGSVAASVAVALGALAVTVMLVADLAQGFERAITWRCQARALVPVASLSSGGTPATE